MTDMYHMRGTLEVVLRLTFIPAISTALMRPRRPKQYCLQLVICIYIYISHKNIKCCVDGFSKQEVNNRTQMKR